MILRICGRDFTVEKLESEPWSPSGMGRVQDKLGKITVCASMPEDGQDGTLIHEVLHAIADETGIDCLNENEQAISTLGCALHAFIRDNSEVVKTWCERIDKRSSK